MFKMLYCVYRSSLKGRYNLDSGKRMGAGLEAFSHRPTPAASPQRAVARGLYNLGDSMVPLVLDCITCVVAH